MKKKVISVMMVLVITLVASNPVFADVNEEIQKYKEQIDQIKKEQKETTDKLTGIEREIAQDTYDMIDLDAKVVEFSMRVADFEGQIAAVNKKLEEQERALQDSAQLYNSIEELYITRLKAIYENGMPSMLDILLSSQSISDFFSKMNALTSILEYDKSLVNNMQGQKEYRDHIKKNVELQKLQLEQLQYDTKKSTSALKDAQDAKQNKISQLEASKENLKEKAEALAKQEKVSQQRMAEEIAKAQAYEGSFSGQFNWPVPGFNIITTRFNTNYDPFNQGVSSIHYGCDIAGGGILSTPIHAIEAGTVIKAGFDPSGYGNYVSIDHGTNSTDGNKYKSLYGHQTRYIVTKGQYVTKGEVIGYVGSTGWSTGPHLHLELYKNNKRVDPLAYYQGMKLIYR